jgi:ribose transport system substrate-binding protein
MMSDWRKKLLVGLAPAVMAAAVLAAAPASADQHYKVFLDMSYSGNTWQAAAANGIQALAATPPYDKTVEFKTVISGTDVQHQISDLQSMIASGANAIILYPLSPTALNRVIKDACTKGVVMFTYDSTVTEPCAHNVSNITARYGANSAQWMVNQMGGAGELIFNHGVAGTTVTTTYDEQAYGVFKKYPGIKIVGDFYGNWNDATSQEEIAKILAAHPNVDGIWTVDGTYGSLQEQAARSSGRHRRPVKQWLPPYDGRPRFAGQRAERPLFERRAGSRRLCV